MTRMANPAAGRVSSEFSYARKHPITGQITVHYGIDIANATGTPINAAFSGTVEKVGWAIVAGRTGLGILIRNPDGERQYYGHLSVARVNRGQTVKEGQRIGDMGETGQVTGPHLHFETWDTARSPRNPRLWFSSHGLTPGDSPHTNPLKGNDMNAEQEWIIRNTMSALAATRVMVVDIKNTLAAMTGTPTIEINTDDLAAEIAAAIPETLAADVVDLLAERLRTNS